MSETLSGLPARQGFGRTLGVIGLALLILALISSAVGYWLGSGRRQSSTVQAPWPNSEEFVSVDVDWPLRLQTNESVWVTVSLAPKARLQNPDFVSNPKDPSQDVVIVAATLTTTSFDIKPVMAEPQAVRGKSRIAWLWMITSKYGGRQSLGILLHVERRTAGTGTLKARDFLYGAGTDVVVSDPARVRSLENLALYAGALGVVFVLVRPLEALLRRIEGWITAWRPRR